MRICRNFCLLFAGGEGESIIFSVFVSFLITVTKVLRKATQKRLCLAHGLRGHSPLRGLAPVIPGQEAEGMDTDTQLTSSFQLSVRPQPIAQGHPRQGESSLLS